MGTNPVKDVGFSGAEERALEAIRRKVLHAPLGRRVFSEIWLSQMESVKVATYDVQDRFYSFAVSVDIGKFFWLTPYSSWAVSGPFHCWLNQ